MGGRFVPFVRAYITVVAGVTLMDRRRFFVWSAIGAVLWVVGITLLGYFLGADFPALGQNIDYVTIAILAFARAVRLRSGSGTVVRPASAAATTTTVTDARTWTSLGFDNTGAH